MESKEGSEFKKHSEHMNFSTVSRRNFLKYAGMTGVLGLAGSALVACGGTKTDDTGKKEEETKQSSTQTVTDMNGTEVEVPMNPTKYADGWFAHNEITIMLTGAEGLVATHCDKKSFPWMYKVCPNMEKATVTFGKDFNFEELAKLEPQVIFDSKEDLRDKAKELGIPLVNCTFNTYETMQKSIELTGQVYGGKAVDIAKKYNDELSSTVASVKEKTDKLGDGDRPSVMHGNSVYTFVLDGKDTIIDTWIQTAGGKNAVTESTEGNAQQKFSLEQIIDWNPEVIITGKADEVDQILADPAWASISAVKNKKVYVNPKGVFGWDRYGVEELLQIQWVSALLHPDIFTDLDIRTKMKDFYKTYLNYELTENEVDLILAAKNPE